MRVLQIIDSLDIGGAEKMAVNYANALANAIEFSGLVATRKEGVLKSQLAANVNYLFLNRKSKLDLQAVFKLRRYCIVNKITHLQAHSSSFFTAFLTKLVLPKVQIIWHDHNGLSEFISSQKSFVLKFTSFFFKGIIVVNDQLKKWAEKELNCTKVLYLPNFTVLDHLQKKETQLFGVEGKRILCLANLRFQKNHFLLVEVAQKLKISHPDWTIHLVGKDFQDAYSDKLKNEIQDHFLSNVLFLYDSCNDTQNIIEQSAICVLSSQSEGLPVAILEYGLNKKPVVSTKVGEIPKIITTTVNGLLVDNYNAEQFYSSLVQLIDHKELRDKMGIQLYQTIAAHHSQDAIIANYINWVLSL